MRLAGMRDRAVGFALHPLAAPACGLVAGAAAITVWLTAARATDVVPRPVPQEPSVAEAVGDERVGPGELVRGTATASTLPGSWPQFRGADRTNVARDVEPLARSWRSGWPRVVWRIPVGAGYAAPAIHNGRVYLIDYDEENKQDAIRCLSLDDGGEIWRYAYDVDVRFNHGMSRTVPAVNDDFVVAIGPKCHVTCLDARTGEPAWKIDLVREHGSVVPDWYAGQCPLIDGDVVVLAPGGDPLMMAVELAPQPKLRMVPDSNPLLMAFELVKAKRVRWQTPNPGGWGMTHSCIVPLDFATGRQYVYCSTAGVVGVSAQTGQILWTKPDWQVAPANMPAPVVVAPDRLFLSGGYESGCVMIRLRANGQRIETEEVFRLGHKYFDSPQQTPILYQGHIYSVCTLGRQDENSQLACLTLDGKRLWTSGRSRRFGLGAYMLADGLLLVLCGRHGRDAGTLYLVEATPSGYHELASAKVLGQFEAWGPMALAGDRLIVRDLREMVCLQLPKAQ